MKLTLLSVWLCMMTLTAVSQSVFRIDSLPANGVVLAKAWKWHLGDNRDWGRVDVDDSQWDTLNPKQDISELTNLPQQGIGWLRIHLYVPPALRGQLIGMFIRQAGATEVFLNGQLMLRNGKISPQHRLQAGDLPNYLSAVPFSHDSLQVMAVRYAFSREHLTNYFWPFYAVRLLSTEVVTTKQASFQGTSLVDTILIGVFLILGILQLLLFSTSTNQRSNLYFGLFLVAQSFVHLNSLLVKEPTLVSNLLGINNQILFVETQFILYFFLLTISILFYLAGIYSFFKQPNDTPFFVAAALNVLSLPLFFLVPSPHTELVILINQYILSGIVPYLIILRVGILSIKYRKQGAILFTVAHSTLLLTSVLMALGDFWPSFSLLDTNYNYLLLISFLGLAITISLLLSQERSATNKLLRKQIIELDSLSQKTLAQEQEKQQLLATQNERLEQQVEARTAELKASQAQLVQKEKLASLGELTAGIAHEIQNPLNFVNNFSELSTELVEELEAEQRKSSPDVNLEIELLTDLKDNLAKITHHGNRASSIVKGMLEHTRRSSGEMTPTDLNKLIDEYIRLVYQGFRAKDKGFNVELVTQFDASLGNVMVMPQEMGRVLLNLFNNAFYAVRQQQKTAPTDYQPLVNVHTERQVNQVVVIVRDNGVGMSDSVKAKIFQPFFTTKPTGEGTGLGLSLGYDIITKGHGGTLTVTSEPGQGAEFVITLPIQPTVT